MKYYKTITIILFTIILFSSCKKNEVKPFIGNYTYQTSGTITIGTDTSDITIPILNSMGQLDIIDIDEDNKVLAIKTSLKGDITQINANIEPSKIIFPLHLRNESFQFGQYNLGELSIGVDGKGTLYGDKIVINEKYHGSITSQYLSGVIKDSDITTVAKRNNLK